MNWKARAQSLAKHSLTNAAGGAKGSALSLAVGFAVFHLWTWISQMSWAPTSPWVMPAALAALGHFLKRKYPAVGVAMLGAVGFALATTLKMQALAKANGAPSPDAKGLYGGRDAALIQEARGFSPIDAALIQEAMRG
jgi:hypothetical protein